MITGFPPLIHVLLCEIPPAEPFDSELRGTLLSNFLERGYTASLVRTKQPPGSTRPAADEQTVLLGRYGGRLPAEPDDEQDGGARWRDVTGLNADQILSLVETFAAGVRPAETGRRWKPWFPVIDFSRCTNCMQCLSFCLFDVYGVTADGRIQVQNENNCKTDCPACSRVCPEVAIMFPKYKAGPINGEEVNTDDIRREAMKVDISALLGGDIYAMLRDRSAKAKSRFSMERDDERALKERERCLTKLKSAVGELEIPPEVLASLPSLDEIQLKAEQARQRAQQALENGPDVFADGRRAGSPSHDVQLDLESTDN